MSALRSTLAFLSGFIIAFVVVFAIGGCASSDPLDPSPPDAALPIDPSGRFAVTSTFSLAAPPPEADRVLDELAATIDGPDDPSRYLIDLMIERLPEGRVRTYATAIAPYVAAYVNERIDEVAPRFVDGSRALATGLSRVAHRFGTSEVFAIDATGDAITTAADVKRRWFSVRRTIVGLRFDLQAGSATVVAVPFAPHGMPDITTATRVELVDGRVVDGQIVDDRLAFAQHAIALPYTSLLRLGLDHAVIPSVVPGGHDLAHALASLVDCAHLGALVSDRIGIGSPGLYETACEAGLTALASRIYDRIDAIAPAFVTIDVIGAALAVDADANGTMEEITGGAWTGTLAEVSVAGTFEGTRR